MIAPQTIMDAVTALLNEAFPGEPVYDKRLPEQFKRPSCYLEYLTRKTKDASFSLLEVEDLFQVTGFVPVDDYYDSQASAVNAKAAVLTDLFSGQSIQAGDRWLHVDKAETVAGLDHVVVAVTLHYMDDTPGRGDPKREFMEHLSANGKFIV